MAEDFRKRRGPDPVSCAECRRLKLKCDRRLPCSSCFRRGCAAICPNGTLSAGTEQKAAAPETQYLHYKIEAMARRIAELEEALAAVQARISDERHPLLADEFVRVKPAAASQPEPESASESLAERFGTLTIGEREHFFGQYAAADYLLVSDESCFETPGTSGALPLDALLLSGGFPMASIREAREGITAKLASWLPPALEAAKLVDTYYLHGTWIFMPISKEEFKETIFTRVFDGSPIPCVTNIGAHELALFYMILALACAADPNRPAYNTDGANYYELGRAALALDSVIEHPTLNAVRANIVMSFFLQMYDHLSSHTTAYALVGLNAQICQGLGLHRDDTPWKLPETEQQRRRFLFWQVVSYDHWSSFSFGRPPCLTAAHVDAKLPEDRGRFLGADGNWHASFFHWLHTFSQKVMLKVLDQAFGVTPPTHAAVLRLDRLIREHPVSDGLRIVDVEDTQSGIPASLVMQRHMIFSLTQRLLLFLHRSFFAQALTEHPEDPLKSKHAQSVLAAFRCAFYITTSARALYTQAPLSLRFWVFWSPIFSACLVLGSIVIKAPGSGLAPPAWVELNRMNEFLEHLVPISRRVARIMPKMRLLRQKAHDAYAAFTAASGGVPRPVFSDLDETEMRFLHGYSRLVDNASKARVASTPDTCTSSSAHHSPPSNPGAEHAPAAAAAGPSTLSLPHDSSSSTLSTMPPNPFDPTPPLPESDIFAALYASMWPSQGQPQQQQPSMQQQQQQQQQLDFLWNFDANIQAPPPFPDAQFSQTQADPFPSWAQQLPDVSARMPASNMDTPWQRFTSGIGVEESPPQPNPPNTF